MRGIRNSIRYQSGIGDQSWKVEDTGQTGLPGLAKIVEHAHGQGLVEEYSEEPS